MDSIDYSSTAVPTTIDPLEHRGLVRPIALRFRGRGLELDDLIAEGEIGLILAARRFDPAMGFKFATYAVPYISGYISRAVRDSGWPIRIPACHADYRRHARRGPLGPSTKELLDQADRILALKKRGGDEWLRKNLPASPEAEPDGYGAEIRAGLLELLRLLTPRERHVVLCFYGLAGARQTASSMAVMLGMEQQAVQKIKEGAIRDLRQHVRARPPKWSLGHQNCPEEVP